MHYTLRPLRKRLTAAQQARRLARIARRRDDIGNRIVARHMRAHGIREDLGRFVYRPRPEAPSAAPGAVFVGPVKRRTWLPALRAFGAAVRAKFKVQKTV